MKPNLYFNSRMAFILLAVTLLLRAQSAFGMSLTLEGQNKGDTNTWTAGNLQGWLELNYIPCRVYASAAAGGTIGRAY